MQKTGDKIFQAGTVLFNPAQKKVICQHRRYGDGDTDCGGDQRIADRTSHYIQAGRAASSNLMHRMHDAQHRAEQADERRSAADTGEQGQAAFHHGVVPSAFAQAATVPAVQPESRNI